MKTIKLNLMQSWYSLPIKLTDKYQVDITEQDIVYCPDYAYFVSNYNYYYNSKKDIISKEKHDGYFIYLIYNGSFTQYRFIAFCNDSAEYLQEILKNITNLKDLSDRLNTYSNKCYNIPNQEKINRIAKIGGYINSRKKRVEEKERENREELEKQKKLENYNKLVSELKEQYINKDIKLSTITQLLKNELTKKEYKKLIPIRTQGSLENVVYFTFEIEQDIPTLKTMASYKGCKVKIGSMFYVLDFVNKIIQ